MDIIRPQSINNVTMLYSSIAEADHAAWAVGTTYTVGDRVILVSPTATITVTIAYPGIVTWSAHGLANDTPVMFTTTGALPTNIVAGEVYYVRDKTPGTFRVALKKGGSAITTTGSQSGVHTATAQVHRIFESLQAGNVGNAPLISPTWWLALGETNRWAMFDEGVASPSIGGSSETIVLQGLKQSSSVMLLNVSAELATFTMSDAGLENGVTITIAAPAVFTSSSHGLLNNDAVTLRTTGALPTGLTALTGIYYVVGATTSTYNLAATSGGAAITTTGTQSGSHYAARVVHNVTYDLIGNDASDLYALDKTEYARRALSTASQETNPFGVAVKPDGLAFYVGGNTAGVIYQYTMGTAWNTSTGVYSGKSLSVAAQDAVPFNLAMSSDGTKLYFMGGSTKSIFQYTLSTAWDISTGVYSGKTHSFVAQEAGSTRGLTFSPDGDRLYMLGYGNNAIYQYALSTAWDVSTISYTGNSLSILSESKTSGAQGIAISPLGDRLLLTAGKRIYQYALATPWNISTGYYSDVSVTLADSLVGSAYGIAFKANGTGAYVVGNTGASVYEYFLGGNIWYVSDFAELTMPVYSKNRVNITLSSSLNNVRLGGVVFGTKIAVGASQYGARVGIQDYSVKKQDDWGNYSVVERGYSKMITLLVLIENDSLDFFHFLLAELRATPVVWIGTTEYTSTQAFGFFKDFSIEIAYPTHSLCSIEIEGLV